MALFNEILAGRFNRFAQKHFSMKGRQGTPTLSADIQMGMDFHSGEESRLHEGWDLFARSFSFATPGVGNLSVLELRNPLASGVIAVVTYAGLIEPTATTQAAPASIQMNRNATADQNNVSPNTPLDKRTLRTNSALILSNNTAGFTAIGGTNFSLLASATAANVFQALMPVGLEVPLFPGDSFMIVSGNTNVATVPTLWWRERALEDSEKS